MEIKLRKRLIYAGDLWHKTFVCEEPGDFRKAIENAPSVDAVEVVRCKDCKCGKHPDSTRLIGKLVKCALYDPMPMMRRNDFCSYGERKDNG